MPSINAANKAKDPASPSPSRRGKAGVDQKLGGLFRQGPAAGKKADATDRKVTVAQPSSDEASTVPTKSPAPSSPVDRPQEAPVNPSTGPGVAPTTPSDDTVPSSPVPETKAAPVGIEPTIVQPEAPASATPMASLGAAAARAAAAHEQDPVPTTKAPMTSLSLYPPEGTAAAFKSMARELGITYGALAIKAVTDHLGALEAQMGPQAVVVAGYAPRNTVKVDRQSIVLRVTRSDAEALQQLADSWPGCRSRNHLLSTAVSMLLDEN